MRKGSILIICLTVFFLLVLPSVMADSATENLESRILESFDPENRTSDWLVVGSKFTTEGFPKQTYTEAWPEAIFGSNQDEKDLQVLGVNVKWDRKGYNYIEIIPVKEDADGNTVPNPISIPGRAKKLDLWVWCSDFDFYFEVHIRDTNGVVHVLNMGSLAEIGWNNFYTEIPGRIAQTGNYVPFLKTLELVKVVIWTKPTENVSNFFVYFDQIKVLTDTFITRFDGDDLASQGSEAKIWGEE
jgi:Flagellar filament outer layer protein Flaa